MRDSTSHGEGASHVTDADRHPIAAYHKHFPRAPAERSTPSRQPRKRRDLSVTRRWAEKIVADAEPDDGFDYTVKAR
jgi:hypothetical protein